MLAAAGFWLLVRHRAAPDPYAAVAAALRQARPADVASITLYPLLPDKQGRPARPFELRTAAAIGPVLRGLQQLRPIRVNKQTFNPFIEATLMVRLSPELAAARQLHSHNVIFRLASAAEGDVALRAYSEVVCQSTALSQRVRHLRDSVDSR
ncbi:MAG: hypothetical protein EOO59_12865 [Hymenobacter sp.]|nr:MAG: hypothetical protein EOO59_12865 [Hymenobacter sp.]